MKRGTLIAGIALLVLGWTLSGRGMTGHMVAHMIAVAVAAPLLALAIQDSRLDPARRWPRLATPMVAALVEAVCVWGWHGASLRPLANHGLLLLQCSTQ